MPSDNITSVTWFSYSQSDIYITRNKRWWEIPAGHIEEWETPIDSLHREIKEEIWWKILKENYVWFYKVFKPEWVTYSLIY